MHTSIALCPWYLTSITGFGLIASAASNCERVTEQRQNKIIDVKLSQSTSTGGIAVGLFTLRNPRNLESKLTRYQASASQQAYVCYWKPQGLHPGPGSRREGPV